MTSPASLGRKIRGWMNRRLPMMITCAKMDALLVDYVDGALPPHQRRRVGLHVRLCTDCDIFLSAYRTTIALSRTAFDDPGDRFSG